MCLSIGIEEALRRAAEKVIGNRKLKRRPAVFTKMEGPRRSPPSQVPPSGSTKNTSGPNVLPMELRNLRLNPPAALPYPEGYDATEWQVPGPPIEQAYQHKGETMVPRTLGRTEDHEVLVSRSMSNVLRYNSEGTIWYSLQTLKQRLC